MQKMRSATSTRFMHAFWGLRQAFLSCVGSSLRRAHDLEPAEFFLLHYIAESTLSPTEIAVSMVVPAHAVSRKVGGLERRGLVTRSLDPADARRRVLTLTPRGHELLAAALVTLEAEIAELLGVLGAPELEAMLSAMETVHQAAKETL